MTYVWDLNNDGTFETTGQNPVFSALIRDGPDTQTVTLQVCDDRGGCDTATATITIANVAPVVTNDRPTQTVQYPGAVAVVTVSATDVTVDMPLSVVTSWTKNGGASQPGLPSGLGVTPLPTCTPSGAKTTCTMATLPGSKLAVGTYVLKVTVSDGDGGIGSTEFTITVVSMKLFAPLIFRP